MARYTGWAQAWEGHCRIVEREGNAEWKAFYQLAWHLGASQGDLANLHAEDVEWASGTINHRLTWYSLPSLDFVTFLVTTNP